MRQIAQILLASSLTFFLQVAHAQDYTVHVQQYDEVEGFRHDSEALKHYHKAGKLISEEHYDSAWASIKMALLLPENGVSAARRGRIKLRAGSIQSILANYEKAQEFTNKALELARSIGDRQLEASCLMVIGGIARTFFNDPNNHENLRNVLGFYEQAQAIYQAQKDTAALIGCMLNLATVNGEIGNIETAWQLLDEMEGMVTFRSHPQTVMQVKAEKGKILCYSKKQLEAGKKLLLEALQISEELQLKTTSEHYLLNLSGIANGENKYGEAIAYLERAGEVFPESPIKGYHDYYYRIYKKMGKFKEALTLLEQDIARVKREHNERNQESVAKWETNMRTQYKEQQLELKQLELDAQRKRTYSLVAIILLSVSLSVFAILAFFRQRKHHSQPKGIDLLKINQRENPYCLQQIAQILFTSSLIFFLHPVHAQDYNVHVQQFGIEDGLAHRDVSTLFKDSHGFLWVATNKKNLQRFDGHEFKTYPMPERERETSSVTHIREDERGWLWMVTGHPRTIFFLHPLTGEMQTAAEYLGGNRAGQLDEIFRGTTNDNLVPSDRGNGHLYFGKENHIAIFDSGDGATKLDMPHFGLVHIHLVDSEGNIWVTPNDGEGQLTKLNPSGRVMASYDKPGLGHSLITELQVYEWEGHIYYFIVFDQDHTGQELYRIGPAGQKESVFSVPDGYQGITMMDGRVWCIGPVGWKVFDLPGQPAFELRRTDYDEKLFEGLAFKNIVSDGKGHYYLPTQFGFNIIEVRKNPFTQYFSSTGKRQLPIKNSARGIHVDEDSITVNFEFGGLVRIGKNDPDNYRIAATSVYSHFDETRTWYNGRPLLEASNGSFWTGHSNSIQNRSASLAEKEHIPLPPEYLRTSDVNWSLWEDGAGCIWAPFLYGMMVYCPGDQTSFFLKNSEMGIGAPEPQTYELMPEGQELLWLCSDKGLFAFDPIERKVRHRYHKKGQGEFLLPGNFIYDMHIDDIGDKWLGTEVGLVHWDIKTGEKRAYNRNDGLSNETIYAVVEDEHDRLWLSSDYGIMSFHKETHKVQTYLPKDGVAQKEFNRLSHFKAGDGTIYFGGLNGVTSFHPDDFLLEKNEYAKLVLTSYELFDGGKEKLVDKIAELVKTNTIDFHPNDRYFKLKFTLPTYNEVDKNLYAWKINGVFDEWNYQKENSLQLASLPYGDYILQIKGQGAKGGWSPHELSINLNVQRPFYLQYWFIISAILFLLGVFFIFYKMRTNNFLRTKKLLELVWS